MDCNANCSGADIVLIRSADGSAWTRPTRVATGPGGARRYYTLPGLAADPARAGRLGLAYYRLDSNGAIDAYFVASNNSGGAWSSPRRLTPQSIRRSWLVDTQYGPMIGDYISTSFVGGRPIPILIIAGVPARNRLDEAVFAALVR
jgi:hypothetical protein